MRGITRNFFNKPPQQIISVVVLTSILSLSTGLTLMLSATAAPINPTVQMVKSRGDRLPRRVANAVLQDLSRRTGIPIDQLKIVEFSQKTWSNGCLGLPQPDEFCTQVLVEGWRVVVSDGRQTSIYRTDSTGRNLRLETQNAADLPQSVTDAVLQEASQRTNLPISQLRIVEAERRQWSDGCLGLGGSGVFCTAIVVPGWLVSVKAGQQLLVYRTNTNGSLVKLDAAVSQTTDADPLQPVPIPTSELPSPLQPKAVFRAINTGGIAGLTTQVNLLKDGQLIRVQVNRNGTTTQTQLAKISRQQVQQFQQLLEQQQFVQFNGLEYPPPSSAADYITVTFTSPDGTTRYSDVNQDRLPSSLQVIIQAWNQLLSQE